MNQRYSKDDDGGSGGDRDRSEEAWRDNILAYVAHDREDWKEHFSQKSDHL